MFSLFELAAMLLTLSAAFGWVNYKFLPLPQPIGLLIMSLAVSLILVGIDLAFPQHHVFEPITAALVQIDFSQVVTNGILARSEERRVGKESRSRMETCH